MTVAYYIVIVLLVCIITLCALLVKYRTKYKAEATVTYYGHQLVGVGSDPDLFTAIHSAAEKLAKQAVKARTKWRDTKRAPRQGQREPAPDTTAAAPEPEAERVRSGAGVTARSAHRRSR